MARHNAAADARDADVARILRQVAPSARDGFLRALEELRSALSVRELADIVRRGEDFTVLLDEVPRRLRTFADYIEAVLVQASDREHENLFDMGLTIDWEYVHPEAIEMAQDHTGQLIERIGAEQLSAIQTIVTRAVRSGAHPYVTARQIRNVVGLNSQQAAALDNYRAKLMIDEVDPDRADILVQRYAERLLKQRAETIARTETLWANNAGQLAVWGAGIAAGDIVPNAQKVWSTSKDERTCRVCAPMNGAAVPMDASWLLPNGKSAMVPTDAHPNCRCGSYLLTDGPAFDRIRDRNDIFEGSVAA